MKELEKMTSGLVYHPGSAELVVIRSATKEKLDCFNRLPLGDKEQQTQIIRALFGAAGDNVSVKRNFWCDYGINIKVGHNFYTNHDCVILDCAEVNIGDNCLIGPQVGIYTACHPLDPIERATGKEFAKPITIGNDCWIGGHATINPGVTLGNNVVVASGSVVTKSFGDNVVIGGNPAKVIKTIE
ncbi:sugar O-acetyltransferase [Vibrio sp. FNV 38]|nr:sugar O-acetyltransferase [Vibrio sp. FNV 38]